MCVRLCVCVCVCVFVRVLCVFVSVSVSLSCLCLCLCLCILTPQGAVVQHNTSLPIMVFLALKQFSYTGALTTSFEDSVYLYLFGDMYLLNDWDALSQYLSAVIRASTVQDRKRVLASMKDANARKKLLSSDVGVYFTATSGDDRASDSAPVATTPPRGQPRQHGSPQLNRPPSARDDTTRASEDRSAVLAQLSGAEIDQLIARSPLVRQLMSQVRDLTARVAQLEGYML